MRVSIFNCVSSALEMLHFSSGAVLNNAGTDNFDYIVVKWNTSDEVDSYLKAEINQIIANAYPNVVVNREWCDDDVIYSIGEMRDRLTIEEIKQSVFTNTGELKKMPHSKQCSNRVKKYLENKLHSVARRGYETVGETRTY